MAKRKLMMLGPPGAGKGTQAQRLATELRIPQISTGDMLREAKSQGTEMGRQAAAFMDAGELVPDEVVIGIVRDRLSRDDAQGGFILDGFPRTRAQAEALEGMGISLDAVLNISVSEDEVLRRLGGRRACLNCGATFHVEFAPPEQAGVCDVCGDELVRRADDEPEAIQTRLRSYEENTAPLIAYYESAGKLVDVAGEGSPDAVGERVAAAVG